MPSASASHHSQMSVMSDTESNVSGFIRYSEDNIKHLYTSMIRTMETVNQDIKTIEKNIKNLVQHAGPLEGQLSALLQSLPKPSHNIPMESMETE